jgi:AcrR family transcriptional regulator
MLNILPMQRKARTNVHMAETPSPALGHRRLMAQTTLLPPNPSIGESRALILDRALRLFAERGFGGTSVRDIAAAAGTQPASMYSHFPSKEHVLAEICRVGHDEFVRHVRAALLASQPDPRDQITAYVKAQVGFHAEYSMLAVVCNSELHMLGPELAAPILALRKNGEEIMLTVIRRGVELGVFKVPHLWLTAAMIGGPALRVAHWYSPDFDVPAGRIGEIYAEYALRILGASTGQR